MTQQNQQKTDITLPPSLKACLALAATMPMTLAGLITALIDGSAIWAAALSPMFVIGLGAAIVVADFGIDILRRVEARRARNRLAARVGKSYDRDARFFTLAREEMADALR